MCPWTDWEVKNSFFIRLTLPDNMGRTSEPTNLMDVFFSLILGRESGINRPETAVVWAWLEVNVETEASTRWQYSQIDVMYCAVVEEECRKSDTKSTCTAI